MDQNNLVYSLADGQICNHEYSVIVNLAMNGNPAKHLLSRQIVAYSIFVSGQRRLLSVCGQENLLSRCNCMWEFLVFP